MNNFSRNDAFSMEIKDPENINENSKIIETLNIGDELYILKTNNIFRMLTAETIDPEQSELETKHSYEKICDLGTASEYVARCVLQAKKLLPLIANESESAKNLLDDVWALNVQLLNCRNIVCELESYYTTLIPQCNQIIVESQSSSTLPPLPKIPELKEKVRVFLTNSKLVLINVFKFLSKFYPINIKDKEESHFNKHIQSLEKLIGIEHKIPKLLQADLEWVRLLSECRNAIEHSGEGQEIDISNFSLKPGNKFSSPTWSYDLTKKLGVNNGPHDLLNDLDVFCSNMLHLFEDLIVLIAQDKLANHPVLAVYKLDEAQINMDCPIKYDITVKSEVVNRQ